MYALTEEATKDIQGILESSIEEFGIERTERYYISLKECLDLLTLNPDMGNNAEDILPNYLRFPHEGHIIFYKISSASILIVRILHKRMDAKKHMGISNHGRS